MEIKTIKIKTKNVEIENNVEKAYLKINEKKYNFAIIDITGNVVTVTENRCIYQTSINDPRLAEIIPLILNPPKQRKPRKKKETKKESKKETKE